MRLWPGCMQRVRRANMGEEVVRVQWSGCRVTFHSTLSSGLVSRLHASFTWIVSWLSQVWPVSCILIPRLPLRLMLTDLPTYLPTFPPFFIYGYGCYYKVLPLAWLPTAKQDDDHRSPIMSKFWLTLPTPTLLVHFRVALRPPQPHFPPSTSH